MKEVYVGDGKIMGVNNEGEISYRTGIDTAHPNGIKWIDPVQGMLIKHITVGDGLIIGVNSMKWFVMRSGVDHLNPYGTGWRRIDEENFKQIDVGDGKIIGVNGRQRTRFRTGVNASHPTGTGWEKLDGMFIYVAVGDGKIMAIDNTFKVIKIHLPSGYAPSKERSLGGVKCVL